MKSHSHIIACLYCFLLTACSFSSSSDIPKEYLKDVVADKIYEFLRVNDKHGYNNIEMVESALELKIGESTRSDVLNRLAMRSAEIKDSMIDNSPANNIGMYIWGDTSHGTRDEFCYAFIFDENNILRRITAGSMMGPIDMMEKIEQDRKARSK